MSLFSRHLGISHRAKLSKADFGGKKDLPYDDPTKFGEALAQRHLAMLRESLNDNHKEKKEDSQVKR
jgi:hypothetical protein